MRGDFDYVGADAVDHRAAWTISCFISRTASRHAHEHRAADDGMADVQLPLPPAAGRPASTLKVVERMTGVEPHAERANGSPARRMRSSSAATAGALLVAPLRMEGVGIRSGVHFAHRRTGCGRAPPPAAPRRRMNTETTIPASARPPTACLSFVSCDAMSKTALGGDLRAGLRAQHRHLGLDPARDADHSSVGGHLEVQPDVGQLAQAPHVLVLDVGAGPRAGAP